MAASKITADQGAIIQMDNLRGGDRERILGALEALGELSVERWPAELVAKLEGEEPLYVLRDPAGLRVIFRVTAQDEIEILDIFRRETLEFFRTGKNGASPTP